MSEAEFVALNQHLEEMRPIFDIFCARNQFVYVERISLGRYPRIRIERLGTMKIWFDLWMELDEAGNRIDRFKRDALYELSAGAYVDVQDGSVYGTRFQKAVQCFANKPFKEVGAVLQDEMQKHLPILENWDVEFLKDKGEKVQLGVR
ncbi:MAG: hypothetical protein ABSD67_20585 [Terracidiphilus sp.]|jgi:hypothetical protein